MSEFFDVVNMQFKYICQKLVIKNSSLEEKEVRFNNRDVVIEEREKDLKSRRS